MANEPIDNFFSGPGVTRSKSLEGLVDPYGREITRATADDIRPFVAPTDPLTGVDIDTRARVVYRDIPISTITTWTIDEIRDALAAHMTGMFQGSAMLADAVLADDRVQATLGSRVSGLLGQPVKHTKADADADGTVLEAWRAAWPKLFPTSVAEDIQAWAILLDVAPGEIRWDTSVTPWQPTLKAWSPQYLQWRWDTRSYWLATLDGLVEMNPGDGRWFLLTPHGFYRGWRRGAVRALAQPWFIRQRAYRDWARYNEVHGLPIITAEVPAVASAPSKAAFTAQLRGLGQESVVTLPQMVDGTGFKLGMLEPRDRSWESFKGTIDRCDTSIVLTLLWQNLMTEVKEGSFAAARMHGDVRQAALEFDASTLSDAIYNQIARPFAEYNFGNADLAPRTVWCPAPPEDREMEGKALLAFTEAVTMMRTAGMEITPEDLRTFGKKYGLDLPNIKLTAVPAKGGGAGSAGGGLGGDPKGDASGGGGGGVP